jgi:hypothetical protein
MAESTKDQDGGGEGEILELMVIGAGPHGLTLLLRLLEEDPDLLSEVSRDGFKFVQRLSHVPIHAGACTCRQLSSLHGAS